MFTSSADVFRTRQAVRDLAEAVGVHRDAVQGLGFTGAERDLISQITANGCRIDNDGNRDLLPIFLMAAALPDEDFESFIGATALLLADRLQANVGMDELAWGWAAFRDHYRLADPPVRAAVMNGFRLLASRGLVTLEMPPETRDCLTFAKGDVVTTLQVARMRDLGAAVGDNASPEEAGILWQNAQSGDLSWQMLVGFRYLYERPDSMAPASADTATLIPWA